MRENTDEMMLPGALKYGGLPALAALAAPAELFVYNHRGTGMGQWIPALYKAAGASSRFEHEPGPVPADKVVRWLLR